MTYFQIYRDLTLYGDKKDINNLIDSLNYFKNGNVFVTIIKKLKELNIDYRIISGFKGEKLYKENNQFKNCIISVPYDKLDILKGILDEEYNEIVIYNIDNDTNIDIQLRN